MWDENIVYGPWLIKMSVLDRNVVDFGHEDDDKVTVSIFLHRKNLQTH